MSNPDDYTIGWICALHEELVAAQAFLDEEHDPPAKVSRHDANDYTLGKIGQHNVVIAVLPSSEYGTASAASVARDMVHSFPNVRLGLLVGIGGGAPSKKHDIRLGDIVVSNTEGGNSSVFQYDFGKTIQGQGFKTTGVLDQPPRALRTAVNGLKAKYARTGHEFEAAINNVFEKFPKLRKKYKHPDISTDKLYRPGIVHSHDNDVSCAEICGDNPTVLVERSERTEDDDNPAIHYGIIASSNQVMKDALVRDSIAVTNNVLCFEMEAAGLMNNFPCLVIRGICDYADSHKKKEWQGYAAMTAAAYAKDVLGRIVPDNVEAEKRLAELLSDDVASMRKATEEHLDISKQGLEIQQEAIQQILSDKEKKCLHLFRRTKSDKDATYEWFKDRVEEQVEGTCEWLTEHDNFKEWLKQDSGPILVSADPGCGKSVLAKYLVDQFLPRQSLSGSVTVCYFFFKDQDQNTVCQALCALLHQLFSQKSHLIHHAMTEYEKNGKGLIDSTQSLWTILLDVVQDPETGAIITILDALDECVDFGDLMRKLEAHFRSKKSSCNKWKCLLTSRPYEQIVSKFRGLLGTFPRIHVPGEESSETMSQEINRVIEHKVNQLAEKKELSDLVKNYLMGQLLKITHRTYLWVYLVFANLESADFKQTLKGVNSAISTLPRSINEAYEQILSKSKEGTTVRKALSIILAAERPLTLSEMNVALNIEVTSRSITDLDLEQDLRFQSRLRSLCGLFVSIYRGKVYFLHQTAREFLLADMPLSAAILTKPGWYRCITVQEAQHVLASICVRFLSFFNSDMTFLTDATSDGNLHNDDPTFLDYSACFWGLHFREARMSNDDAALVCLASEVIMPKSKAYSVWFKIFRQQEWGMEANSFSTGLMVASYFGHSAIVQLLLDKGADVNAQGGDYGNALYSAAGGGHEQVVKLLLNKGADVNAQGGHYGNALQAATQGGNEQVVKLLLDMGANVNAQGGYYDNALYIASEGGHEQVVKLLLNKGADINAQGGDYGSALYIASEGGHKQVVKLLLDKGADVNAQDGYYRNALYTASEGGHKQVVKLLLDKGADVNAQGGYYGNALYPASQGGHEQVVKLLLDKGADVNAQGGHHGNALQAASFGGHQQIVKLLLDKGANVNAQGGPDGNALLAASSQSHEQVVKLLLDKGADVNAQGEPYASELLAASLGGDEQIVKRLLEKGADINAQGGAYKNALQAASSRSHEEIVKLLLDKGADVNAQGGHHGNALQAASFGGHKEIVKLLLDKGANVNAQGGPDGNALLAASSQSHEHVVKLLVDKGANINAQGGPYGNELQAASFRGHEQIVKLLLEKRASTNAQGGPYGKALQAASFRGHEHIVKLLLEKGADINAQSEPYGSALQAASFEGHEQVVKLLLEKGAGINVQGGPYGNALHAASFGGHKQVVKLLLAKGADVHHRNIDGRTALHFAARGGHVDTFQFLIDLGLDPATTDAKGDDVLCYASSSGCVKIISALLDKTPDPPHNTMHWSPLHWACRAGKPEVVELMIMEGCQSKSVVLSKPEGQWSPLAIALFHGNEEMMNRLSLPSRSQLGPEADTTWLRGERHGRYWCNGCLNYIYGSRFHCRTCSGLDYCFMCKPFLGTLHENHGWDNFEVPDNAQQRV